MTGLPSLANKDNLANLDSPMSSSILRSPSQTTSYHHSFLLDNESFVESLSFKEILQLFGCAISQEQAWAVLNQCLHELKFLMDNNCELLKLNQESIDISILHFTKDGTILFDFDVKSKNTDREVDEEEKEAGKSISWSSNASIGK